MSSAKRGKSGGSADAAAKRSRTREEDGPFTIWTKYDEDYAIYCVTDTHAKAHAKVNALEKEKEAYVNAGGSLRGAEHRTFYFYTGPSGFAFDSYIENGQVKWKHALHTDDYNDKGYTSTETKVGKRMTVEMSWGDAEDMWGSKKTSSMKFAATEDGDRIAIPFWRNIRLLDKAVIDELREIYACGDYKDIPSAEDLDKQEELRKDREEEEGGG